MLMSVEELCEIPELFNIDRVVLERKLGAIEDVIRRYTANNFQNKNKRFNAPSAGGVLRASVYRFNVGDSVQITRSENEGLYTIRDIDNGNGIVRLDKELYDCEDNFVTKIEYPKSVVEGAVSLLLWDISYRQKAGIQSETIARHTVTYATGDSDKLIMGYPAQLLGFLKPHMRARF